MSSLGAAKPCPPRGQPADNGVRSPCAGPTASHLSPQGVNGKANGLVLLLSTGSNRVLGRKGEPGELNWGIAQPLSQAHPFIAAQNALRG